MRRPGRCLAPDLIGMGESDKLLPSGPDSYTLVEHVIRVHSRASPT